MRAAFAFLMISMAAQAAVVIDRIAVVVNRHPVKSSDIERDVRLTDFLNQVPFRLDAAAEKAAEERLIDQQIIRQEVSSGGYKRATDADAEALLDQIRRDRFGGSDARLRAGLIPYGLTEEQLRAQLLWQLTVLRFINDRFRTAVLVTDEDVQKYYEEHRASIGKSLADASAPIRSTLEGNQVTEQFETWLADERKRTPIEYKTGAIQ
jgi:hypothetical protein